MRYVSVYVYTSSICSPIFPLQSPASFRWKYLLQLLRLTRDSGFIQTPVSAQPSSQACLATFLFSAASPKTDHKEKGALAYAYFGANQPSLTKQRSLIQPTGNISIHIVRPCHRVVVFLPRYSTAPSGPQTTNSLVSSALDPDPLSGPSPVTNQATNTRVRIWLDWQIVPLQVALVVRPPRTMGLTEALVDRISVQSALVFVPGLVLAYVVFAAFVRPAWEELKLARMPGKRAPRIHSKLPFSE